MSTEVTPCCGIGSQNGSQNNDGSKWVWLSMNPGVTTAPPASSSVSPSTASAAPPRRSRRRAPARRRARRRARAVDDRPAPDDAPRHERSREGEDLGAVVGDGDGVLEVGGAACRRAVTTVQPSSSSCGLGGRRRSPSARSRARARSLSLHAPGPPARSSGPAGPRASRCRCRGRRTRAPPMKPAASAMPSTAAPTSPRRLPSTTWSIAASSERRVTSMQPRRLVVDLADGTVTAASACQPSMIAPQSIERMSPSSSTTVVARDAVHDHVVGRRADHRGEPVVAEEVRAGAAPLEHLARDRGRRRAWSRPASAARMHTSCISATTRPARRIERDLLRRSCA